MGDATALSASTMTRLETQLGSLELLLGGVSPQALERRPAPGKWSAHDNLAHLARYHEVFLERLRQILAQDAPRLGLYRAESDPEWPNWTGHSTEEILTRMKALRGELIEGVKKLTPEQLRRTGVHPSFGEMTIPMWLELFLDHEGHHLYVVLQRTRESR